jgi:hypothetical protein
MVCGDLGQINLGVLTGVDINPTRQIFDERGDDLDMFGADSAASLSLGCRRSSAGASAHRSKWPAEQNSRLH